VLSLELLAISPQNFHSSPFTLHASRITGLIHYSQRPEIDFQYNNF